MKGFEESGRIEPEQLQSQTILESNEEFAQNSSLAEIENSLQKYLTHFFFQNFLI